MRYHTIRFRLLLAVNTALATLLLVFLVVDYRRETAQWVAQKRVSLEEEAKTVSSAVVRLLPRGADAVQEFLDSTCGRMQEGTSPGHHIAVRAGNGVFQARSHQRSSPEMLAAMDAATRSKDHRAVMGGQTLVVGSDHQGDTRAYVSEYLSDVERAARWQVLQRLVRIVLMMLVAASIINVMFLRMVARPLESLVYTVGRIGEGQWDVRAGPFNSAEFNSLGEAINAMSSSLARSEQQRRQQMAKARRIQQHLLPHSPNVPGLSISHLYQPASDVAGDYFDVLPLIDGSWLLCVADVTGHGIPAAMNAVMLKTLLTQAAEQAAGIDLILQKINERFAEVCLPEDFASMLLVRWDPAAATLDYASAGHESALLLSAAGRLQALPSTGTLLAIQEDAVWEVRTLEVGEGDRLLMMTDGVAESLNGQAVCFGRDALASTFRDCRHLPLKLMVAQVDEALSAHRGGLASVDDVTLVAVEFTSRRVSGGCESDPSLLSADTPDLVTVRFFA